MRPESKRHTPANMPWLDLAQHVFAQQIERALTSGVYGEFGVCLTVHDGIVQGVREKAEQTHRPQKNSA